MASFIDRPEHRQMLDDPSPNSLFPCLFPGTLRHQLDDTTSLCDLAFGELADISGADDEGESRQTSFA